MASARLTPLLVEQIVSTLTADPDRHVVLAPGHAERPRVQGQSLHRYLYERIMDEPLGAAYLLPGRCDIHGCLNPWHRIVTDTPAERTKCPNGHRYRVNDEAPGKYRCPICYEARKARRRVNRKPKARCHRGHRLTRSNVYEWTDRNGIRHRRCRQCQIDTQREYRARQRENA